ncbi:MAG: BON domain-containing protein [Bacillota bacterium]
MTRSRSLFLIFAWTLLPAAASADEVVRNAFGDPFFRVRSGIPSCPEPLGPFMTEEQKLRQTHHRLERGTRCWLAKKCDKPSAYMYDADIGRDVRARFEASGAMRDTSLWVTVQGRIVRVEGCVGSSRAEREIKRLLHDVPDVDGLLVSVSKNPRAAAPYAVPGPGQRRAD